MTMNLKITNFEGPFDLLLHLIKKDEMDIYNIRIFDITNQYLEYLSNMKEMDLDITSEFIVMAATLLEIKSALLLPKEKEKIYEDEKDLTKQLIEKLVEYKKIKKVAIFLKEQKNSTGVIFYKKAEIIQDNKGNMHKEDLLRGITLLYLYNLYNELINRFISKANTENIIQTHIPMDKFKIEDKMEEIWIALQDNKSMNFSKVIYNYDSKNELVVTFLALLELVKVRDVKVLQENNFSDIFIERILTDERLPY